jgi:hypothetical protein
VPEQITQTVDRPDAVPPIDQSPVDRAQRYAPSFDAPAPGVRYDEHGLPIDPNYTPRFGETPVAAVEAEEGEPPLTEAEQGYIDRSVAFPHGRSYFPHTEPHMTTGAANIVVTEGWYLVAAHGEPDRIALPNADGDLEEKTPAQFKRILDNDPTWDGKSNVVFASCEVGQKFVAELYELYDGEITMEGPHDFLFIAEDGSLSARRLVRDPVTQQPVLDDAGEPTLVPVELLWWTYDKRSSSPEGQPDAQGPPV